MKFNTCNLRFVTAFMLITIINDLHAQFQKHIPSINASSVSPLSISFENINENYFIAGDGRYSNSIDPFLLKTDKDGEAIWLKHYELPSTQKRGRFSDATTMHNMPNLIAATGKQHFSGSGSNGRMIVSQVDASNGSAVRNVSIFPSTMEWIGSSRKVISSNGTLAVFGAVKRQNENYKIAISTFDPFLNQINSALLSFYKTRDQIPLDAIKVEDGYIIVSLNNVVNGYSIPTQLYYGSELLIIKVDDNLNVKWNKAIKLQRMDIRGSSITLNETTNEDVYIVGDFLRRGGQSITPFLLKMNLDGKVNWMKSYKGQDVLSALANSVSYNPDSNELNLSTEFRYSLNPGTIYPAGYIKVDTDGRVSKTEYFRLTQLISPGYYIAYDPYHAREIINNDKEGFSLVASRSYLGNSTTNPIAPYGVVIIETDKDGSHDNICSVPIDLEDREMKFIESDLIYLGSSSLDVQPFEYKDFDEDVLSLTCDQDFHSNVSEEEKAQIFPNPASDTFRVLSSKSIEKLVVYDEQTIRIEIEDYTSEERIDVRSLEPGFYFVEIRYTEGETEVFTLVKQ